MKYFIYFDCLAVGPHDLSMENKLIKFPHRELQMTAQVIRK